MTREDFLKKHIDCNLLTSSNYPNTHNQIIACYILDKPMKKIIREFPVKYILTNDGKEIVANISEEEARDILKIL